jgi:hypothetical protein
MAALPLGLAPSHPTLYGPGLTRDDGTFCSLFVFTTMPAHAIYSLFGS